MKKKASRPQRQMKKSLDKQVDERDGGETGEDLGEICGCFSVLEEVSLKLLTRNHKQMEAG